MSRAALDSAKRIVVKVGSRSLVAGDRFASIAADLAKLSASGREVVLVSSGAIAMGREALGFDARPRAIDQLQAAAAVGQSRLMRRWEESYPKPVAQLLLTHADLADRDRYLNARASLDALLMLGVLPIINENDTIAVDEIRFGDNDQLAAMVATLVGAELLILLTDVDGVLDEHRARIPEIDDVESVAHLLRASEDDLGSGGMSSKLDAAQRATKRGVPVVIGRPEALLSIARGNDDGTLVLPRGVRLASRKHWIAYTLKPRGVLVVDAGAARAISKASSLLSAGVVGVRGDFEPGDAVSISGPDGEVARGLARYRTADVARLAGMKSDEIDPARPGGGIIVHRDDLVPV